jgi:hypothetical protein
MMTATDIKNQFLDSLKRGTGEAYLIGKENPAIDFSNYIIKGALRNYAYDGQSEPSRAQYIFDLISLLEKKEKIRRAILKGLATEQEHTWSLTHLFDLVKLFARQGDQEAKQAIYGRFLNHPIEGSDWVGYEEILELDGLQGLFYIAERFGKVIEQNPEDWQTSSIIDHFQNDNPKIKVKEELENVAKINKHIRLYLDNIKRTERNWEKNKRNSEQFKDLVDEVLNSKPYLSYRRTKKLNDIELKTIAEKLINERDSSKIEKLLYVFTHHRFPLDNEFILKLAKQRPTSKIRVNEFAIYALKFLKSENIRDFALDKISKTNKPDTFIKIFVSNFEEEDSKLLTEIARKTKNEHKIESLARSYVEIFEANKTKECNEPLETLYHKMNCGICRNAIIELLIENDVLTDELKKEIKYDSYLETRELVDRKKNGR